MTVQKHIVGSEPLVSGLITNEKLTVADILVILGNGGKIRNRKLGYLVWLNGSKLTSDTMKFIESIPSFIFNGDISWERV